MARQAGYRFADDADQRMANHGQWQRNLLEAFAKLIAAKYEDEIQDLKDMIMELMEQSE